ncbi:hypothetical protein FA95DRAFT_1676635 [Auriscalpium vulgare]|uniref:Uncharacterized protein n=1 Tax=Auriscalpium vulgare TaxID=40419 RepID=A0ACB8S3Z5_9AGAM|nr:hypothetical protein FA95DRAFT_1676635 [Auriscalpium vulgare]
MFRASPWITYDPPALPSAPMDADHDADLDAPQISTLREEDTPPPPPSPAANRGKFRVKLLVNEPKPGTKFITFNGETGEEAAGASDAPDEEDAPEDDDEEDELIDDDEELVSRTARRTQAKGKAAAKRKAARAATGAPASKPLTTSSEAAPPESHLATHSPPRDVSDVASVEAASPMPPAVVPAKRKAVPKGTTAAQRAPRKSNTKFKTTITIPPFIEPADLSEGYTGTAPSSPVAATLPPSPSPPPVPSSLPSTSATPAVAPPGIPPPPAPTLPPGVPLPVYPLPTKPFPVQNAPKLSTGYAPVVPLDRTGKKPRHWRLARREVRGIAGGRWFAQTWVGAQESQLTADPVLGGGMASLTLPKLPALTLSASMGRGRGRGVKSEVASTAASSRAASIAPEPGTSTPVAARTSTKKKSALSTAVVDAQPMEIDTEIAMAMT